MLRFREIVESFGISAEIAARIAESGIVLKSPLSKIILLDIPALASRALEEAYYLNEKKYMNLSIEYSKKILIGDI